MFKFLETAGSRSSCGCPWLDHDDVFESDAADAEIIKPRLHGDHMAGAQDRVDGRDARRLVNVQTQAMAGAVEKALHAAVDFPGRKAAARRTCSRIFW